MIQFEVKGLPKPKGSFRPILTKTGRIFMQESAGKPLNLWMNQVRMGAIQASGFRYLRLEGPISLGLTFWLPRPGAHQRAVYHAEAPDCDKLVRGVCDALTRAQVYRDDKQVARLVVEKRYVTDGHPFAGASITLDSLSERREE